MDPIQQEPQETDQRYRAALAENRGLRKRLKMEREVMRGLLKGLVDPQALNRLIAHLDLLVAKSEAADLPTKRAHDGNLALALEELANTLTGARDEQPDAMRATLMGVAKWLRRFTDARKDPAQQAQQPTEAAGVEANTDREEHVETSVVGTQNVLQGDRPPAYSEVRVMLVDAEEHQPTAAVADAETAELLRDVCIYLTNNRTTLMHWRDKAAAYLRLLARCEEARARLTSHPAAAPAKVAVDPQLMYNVQRAWDTVRDVYMHRGHWDDALTNSRLNEAAKNLELAVARLQGGLPGLSVQPAAIPAQIVVDPEVMEELARVEQMLDGHVVGTRGIEATEGVIADVVARLRGVLAVLHKQAVSPKATPVVPEWLHELEAIQREIGELHEAQQSGGVIDLSMVYSHLGKLILALRHPGAKATV